MKFSLIYYFERTGPNSENNLGWIVSKNDSKSITLPHRLNFLYYKQKIYRLQFWLAVYIPTLRNKSFNSEKIQPNLIPSKIIPIWWVDLNSKIKFAICHWTWEIGWIWHIKKILAVSSRITVFSTRFELLGRFEQ